MGCGKDTIDFTSVVGCANGVSYIKHTFVKYGNNDIPVFEFNIFEDKDGAKTPTPPVGWIPGDCGGGGGGGSSTIGIDCNTPSFTKLCELQEILDALNAIKLQINGDDIAININLDQLESLISGLATQLTQPNINHVVVDNFPVDELAAAICACQTTSTRYDINETQINSGTTPLILPANTYHSISVLVLSGSFIINNNGVSFTAPETYYNEWEATSLLANPITITALNATDIIIVDTIK